MAEQLKLWICQECGTTHMVRDSQIGRRAQCRGCEEYSVAEDHTEDTDAQARGLKLRAENSQKR